MPCRKFCLDRIRLLACHGEQILLNVWHACENHDPRALFAVPALSSVILDETVGRMLVKASYFEDWALDPTTKRPTISFSLIPVARENHEGNPTLEYPYVAINVGIYRLPMPKHYSEQTQSKPKLRSTSHAASLLLAFGWTVTPSHLYGVSFGSLEPPHLYGAALDLRISDTGRYEYVCDLVGAAMRDPVELEVRFHWTRLNYQHAAGGYLVRLEPEIPLKH